MGDYLLFAVEGDPCIYYIHCDKSQQMSSSSFSSSAVKCADLSIPMFETGPDSVSWVVYNVVYMCAYVYYVQMYVLRVYVYVCVHV